MKQIDDLYEYFSQPWMTAMYQMTFKNLMNDINDQDVGTVSINKKYHFQRILERCKIIQA